MYLLLTLSTCARVRFGTEAEKKGQKTERGGMREGQKERRRSHRSLTSRLCGFLHSVVCPLAFVSGTVLGSGDRTLT